MATLQQLQTRKRELEDKLHAGDLSVEKALEQLDRAISARTLKVQHSRQRLEATKQAVAAGVRIAGCTIHLVEAGMDKDEARRIKTRAMTKKLAEVRAKQKLNRF